MSIERIQRTFLWKSTLAEVVNDDYKDEREKLRRAFLELRSKVENLVNQTAGQFPQLTLHDINHLDALWEISSIITGENFELTPLEGFVLGCSFLIHDTALCYEAYIGGKDTIRSTIEWKDINRELVENNATISMTDAENQADFLTIRLLHAQQAKKLLQIAWKDSTGHEFYLLENSELRTHLGMIIGEIASSHHWDIEAVDSMFKTQVNALTCFPRSWRIDPFKLACILRCADAAHIDNERAPDFLNAIIKREGLSLNHWTAQNRLAKVDIDSFSTNQNKLLFTSTVEFEESSASAWFVAYDAICIVDKEIKSCNKLLYDRYRSCFKVIGVTGIETPKELSLYVKTKSWNPCSAQIHVGNIKRLIENFGGKMLYGADSDFLGVVLRELVQNARDAIKARSVFDMNFIEKILISIEKHDEDLWLSIEDNGIGMSERVMTGPLLDFGESFWYSSLVRSEFPGLRSSKFKSIGRFGVGFYSVFTISDSVNVASRNYLSGFSDITQIKFNNGLTLRPILVKGAPSKFNSQVSTQVKIKLNKSILSDDLRIEIKTNQHGMENFKVPLEDYLAALFCGLDVSIFLKEFEKDEVLVHRKIDSKEIDIKGWLCKMSFANFQPDSTRVLENIDKNYPRVKPIISEDRICGLAAISINHENGQDFLSASTVGGLSYSVHSRDSRRFIGYMDYNPKSAKRDTDTYIAQEKAVKQWALDQFEILINTELNPLEKYSAALAFYDFEVDPIDIANVLIVYNGNSSFVSFKDLANISLNHKILFLESDLVKGHMETHYDNFGIFSDFVVVRPLNNGNFLSLSTINGIPEKNFGILGCLYRSILKIECSPMIENIGVVTKSVFGYGINGIVVSSENK